jgi:predicted  nucleic acid-binding Zn-ribbon protein
MKTYQYLHPFKSAVRAALFLSALFFLGCSSTYYATMEKFGIEKRDILVDRVESARDDQQKAKEQFESALEEFIAVTNYQGGDLEKQYNSLKSEFEDSEARAKDVSDRIDSVEQVAEDLFAEWNQELKQYTNQELRASSQRQLYETKKRYKKLIAVMKNARTKITPVLDAFRDRVLFLKHNLNAHAITSLKNQRDQVKSDIRTLIEDMNKSIAEADRFVKAMK